VVVRRYSYVGYGGIPTSDLIGGRTGTFRAASLQYDLSEPLCCSQEIRTLVPLCSEALKLGDNPAVEAHFDVDTIIAGKFRSEITVFCT
jgi:hypothetical protein